VKKRKIAVVGKGTAGSQAAAYFATLIPEFEVEWYFDPNKPTQSVGEGSTLKLPNNLFENVGFTHGDLKNIKGTFKTGIYKENWGSLNKSFFHDFPPPQSGYHFNAVELQNYLEKYLEDKVSIIRESVSYQDIDADFILNASGVPQSFDDFHTSEYIPVNAAYITQCYWDSPEFDYSLTIAQKYGWVFGIPLQNRCSIGYLYNDNINTEEEVAEDVKKIFAQYGLTPSNDTNSLRFKNYYRKQNYERNGRIAHSGNASFFLEPLEATSIGFMDHIQRSALDIWTGYKKYDQANEDYRKLISQIELVIMIHYAAGSSFDTEFWDFAKERGIKKLESQRGDEHLFNIYSSIKDVQDFHLSNSQISEYGLWWAGSFVQNINGLGIRDLFQKFVN